MSAQIPQAAKAWLDGGEFVTVATISPGGQPQLSVLWVDRDGDEILLSTLEGRQKHTNLTADPRITVLCYPKDAPYSYLEVRGTATMTREGGPELIEKLSQRYTGGPYTNDGPGDVRVVIRITPEKVVFRG
jgi:PPOX class probable F420-dependent enzyme